MTWKQAVLAEQPVVLVGTNVNGKYIAYWYIAEDVAFAGLTLHK